MNVELVVFDLDGTLVDSVSDIAIAASKSLEFFGMVSPLDREGRLDPVFHQDVANTLGYGLIYTIEQLAKKYIPNFDMVSTVDKTYGINLGLQYYLEHPVDTTIFYDGIEELLHMLLAMEIKIAILSNKDDNLLQIVAKILFGNISFFAVQGALNGVKKPKKEVFQAVVGTYKAIMIGDLDIDVDTAINAGVPFVGAGWGNYVATRQAEDHTILLHPSLLIEYIHARNTQ